MMRPFEGCLVSRCLSIRGFRKYMGTIKLTQSFTFMLHTPNSKLSYSSKLPPPAPQKVPSNPPKPPLSVVRGAHPALFAGSECGASTLPISRYTTRKNRTAEKLYVWEGGKGEEPVIMLHSLASTYQYWMILFEHLNKKRFKYLVPDLLGHGRSPKGSHLNYDMDTHLYYIYRDVFKINNDDTSFTQMPLKGKASRTPAHLIGHGLGALLALEIAARTPDLVQSLTLISFPYVDPTSDIPYLSSFFSNHVIFNNKLLCALSTNLFKYNSWMLKPFIKLVTEKPQWLVIDCIKHANSRALYSTFLNCIQNYTPDASAQHLCNIGFPVVLIHGQNDEITPLSQVKRFYSKYSETCQIDIFIGAGHDIALFNAEQIAAHLNKGILS